MGGWNPGLTWPDGRVPPPMRDSRARASHRDSGGQPAMLAVLGMHLKAIPTDPHSCHKREGQAQIAQRLLATALNETDYVVAMGDLNDFDGDPCARSAAPTPPRGLAAPRLPRRAFVVGSALVSANTRCPCTASAALFGAGAASMCRRTRPPRACCRC